MTATGRERAVDFLGAVSRLLIFLDCEPRAVNGRFLHIAAIQTMKF